MDKSPSCIPLFGGNMTEIEDRLDNVIASLAIEGMHVTESEKELARKCMLHEISYDDAVASLIEKYTHE